MSELRWEPFGSGPKAKGDQRDARFPDRTKTNRRVGYHNVFTTLTHCGFATRFYAK